MISHNFKISPVDVSVITFNVGAILLVVFGNMFLFVAAEVVAGSAAWIGRGLSCVCAQRSESDARPSFDLTPAQVY